MADPIAPSTSDLVTALAPFVALDEVDGSGGVVWSASPPGVHVNLVVLEADDEIGRHVNDSVHVVMVVLHGQATVFLTDPFLTDPPDLTTGERAVELGPHDAVVIPRGARRGVSAGSPGVRYLSIHTERPPPDLTPTRRPD